MRLFTKKGIVYSMRKERHMSLYICMCIYISGHSNVHQILTTIAIWIGMNATLYSEEHFEALTQFCENAMVGFLQTS